MTFAFGTPIVTGAFDFGPGSFGVLGANIAATGIDGPAYPYNSLDLPADATKEFMAWITTPPTQGVLTINPTDFSFTWTGLPTGTHSFGFTLVQDGVVLSPERFFYAEVNITRELSGTATVDDVLASGGMFVAQTALYGTATLDDVSASGQIECINPSTLSGTATLDDVNGSGSLGVQADDAPLTAVEMRQLYNWLRDLHMIHGLQVGAPLVVGQTSRVAGAINQTIEDVGGATVITRG